MLLMVLNCTCAYYVRIKHVRIVKLATRVPKNTYPHSVHADEHTLSDYCMCGVLHCTHLSS